jgi:hypothetical protein
MRACVQEQDDGRRLACYDREMARTEKSFGLNDEQKRKLDRSSPVVDAKPPVVDIKPQTVPSSVVAVTLRTDGRNVITLQNGQIWVQGEAFEHTEIRVGDSVTVKSGLLGALYMYLPKGRTRVTRER